MCIKKSPEGKLIMLPKHNSVDYFIFLTNFEFLDKKQY